MSFSTLHVAQHASITILTLNRPEVHNAFNEEMIAELTQVFEQLKKDDAVRVIVLTGQGGSFCAGGDLNWMKKMQAFSFDENVADAKALHRMLLSMVLCPKPVIAKINGATMGGGVGLAAAADMAFAYKSAMFSLTEVRLGLIPAVISPFVIRKIGEGRFREYAMTAERFSAMQAKDLGLISQCGDPEQINELVEIKAKALLAAGPEALRETKKLILAIKDPSLEKMGDVTAQFLAERRASAEGQEGMGAFFEKRKPKWMI